MKVLGYLLGIGMVLEGAFTLLSPRMVLETYRRWRGVIPRPVYNLYEDVGSLPDHTLRGVAAWELLTGLLLVALARRVHD